MEAKEGQRSLANVGIFRGISVEKKKKKNGASWVETLIAIILSGISDGYPSHRQASAVFSFFPRTFLGISLR